jgi:ABC-type arginine transport system permease subunit
VKPEAVREVTQVEHEAAHASPWGWGEAGDARGVSRVTLGLGVRRGTNKVAHASLVRKVAHEAVRALPRGWGEAGDARGGSNVILRSG